MYNGSLDELNAGNRFAGLLPKNKDLYAVYGKRALDLVLSILIAPTALLVIAISAIVMFATGDRGNVLFGHRRIGKDGKVFKCWKIRTMVVDAEAKLLDYLASNPEAAAEWARDHKLENDPRVTKFGAFLRKTSLDEFPQIWNVFLGDMSLVGPRPIVRSELHKYGTHRTSYKSLKPGVTGLWQVSGRNDISYDERVELDVKYLSEMAFVSDMRILSRTAKAVLARTGK